MPVKQLIIKELGPFDVIEFQFDPKVNVFIGPNNSGKSTALMTLAEAIVIPFGIPERFFHKNKKPDFIISSLACAISTALRS